MNEGEMIFYGKYLFFNFNILKFFFCFFIKFFFQLKGLRNEAGIKVKILFFNF